MTWAFKRQISYIFIVLAFFGITGYLIIHSSLDVTPTCSDFKQNGSETGVDCGGSCTRACSAEVDKVTILWARSFKVVPGRYNAVAYLENHNQNTVAEKVTYRFRFADKDNIYIGKSEGTMFVPAGMRFAVFSPGIDVGNSIPVYTTFQITSAPVWITVPTEKLSQIRIVASDIRLNGEDTLPTLTATLSNKSLFTIPEVNAVAILYDKDNNAISASSSYLDQLNKEESMDVNFTWPEPFPGKVVSKEIIPMFNILGVKIK
ncbi:MAG: hypothetical protein KBD55_03160 [Candidatus Pacebacteria bacterium]|nr:hypothetical protein [Candidatus Paceibacterota bacterium]